MAQFWGLLTAVQFITRKLYNVMLYLFALVKLFIPFISFLLLFITYTKNVVLVTKKTIVKKLKTYNPPAAC